MRTNLKVFRVKQDLTQGEMSEKIGCSRATYAAVESGSRNGGMMFWNSFQQAFALPDDAMWELTKNDE